MNIKLRLTVPFLCAVMALSLTACQRKAAQSNRPAAQATQTGQVTSHGANVTHTNDASLIPSINSVKVRTTNEYGGTSYGLGSSVYSLIGSSSLHSNGFSSHLESRLSGEGIGGVKVFVIDDTVILATESRQATGSQYDPMQQKVLSYNGGQSGHGPEPASRPGTTGTLGVSDDNLERAAGRMKDIMGGNVNVLMVTNPEAVRTIDRLRANTAKQNLNAASHSEDIRKLLQLAMENK